MPDPDVIVVIESPLHPGGLPLEIGPERLARYERAMVTAGPERPGSIYDWQDEFYIPLAGIDHLDRPGPRIALANEALTTASSVPDSCRAPESSAADPDAR